MAPIRRSSGPLTQRRNSWAAIRGVTMIVPISASSEFLRDAARLSSMADSEVLSWMTPRVFFDEWHSRQSD